MTLLDGQYRFDNPDGVSLVMGAGTPYRVITVSGLRALAPISASDTKRSGQHGTLRAGRRTYGLRVMQLDVVIDTTEYPAEDVEMLIDDFYSCYNISDNEGAFVFKRRAKEERLIKCTPRLAEFPGDYDSWVGSAAGSVQLAAEDPRVYSSLAEAFPFVASVAGGRTYDRVYPVTYSGSTSSTTALVNRGNEDSPPLAQFYGPLTDPGLLNLETGQVVKLNYDIPDGSLVEVDFDLHTITLDGVSRRAMLDPISDWWSMNPGTNTIAFEGEGAGQAILFYSSAWVSG